MNTVCILDEISVDRSWAGSVYVICGEILLGAQGILGSSFTRSGEVEDELVCVIFKVKQKEKTLNTGLKPKREIFVKMFVLNLKVDSNTQAQAKSTEDRQTLSTNLQPQIMKAVISSACTFQIETLYLTPFNLRA